MKKIKYIWLDISKRVKSGRMIVGNKTKDKFRDSILFSLEYSVILELKTKRTSCHCLVYESLQSERIVHKPCKFKAVR